MFKSRFNIMDYIPNSRIPARQVIFAIVFGLTSHALFATKITRVTVSSSGQQGNGYSGQSSMSADGRLVAFISEATNLVSGDTNNRRDVFVHDRFAHQTTRVSVNDKGHQGNNFSDNPVISANGRYVAFLSLANNLVPGDTNNQPDVFVYDRLNRKITRVSVSSNGLQSNNSTLEPNISADGRFVVYLSNASNLVANDTNGVADIFVHDRLTRQTSRVSVDSAGNEGDGSYNNSSISSDGRYVAFEGVGGDNRLVPGGKYPFDFFYVHDRLTRKTMALDITADQQKVVFSGDGRFLAFESRGNTIVPNDTNGASDVFVHDLNTRKTTRVSVDSAGKQLSNDSTSPLMSTDGRFVAFSYNVGPPWQFGGVSYPDVFVHDRLKHKTDKLNINISHHENDGFFLESISADGRFLTFESLDDRLMNGDANGHYHTFVVDRLLNSKVKADLSVKQFVADKPVRIRDKFNFTVVLTNNGPNDAAGVTLTNLALPNGNANVPSLLPSQGSCSKGQVSICRIGNLGAGKTAKISVNYVASKVGQMGNKVSVNAPPFDPLPLNNQEQTVKVIAPLM